MSKIDDWEDEAKNKINSMNVHEECGIAKQRILSLIAVIRAQQQAIAEKDQSMRAAIHSIECAAPSILNDVFWITGKECSNILVTDELNSSLAITVDVEKLLERE